jgi:hypothetical protein
MVTLLLAVEMQWDQAAADLWKSSMQDKGSTLKEMIQMKFREGNSY